MRCLRWPRRGTRVVMMVACCFLLPGCYDATEVENLNIVVGIGIDETPTHQVRVSLEIVKPTTTDQGASSSSQGMKASFVLSSAGSNIDEAIYKFNQFSPRRMYFPHNAVVVFGKQYAEDGIDRAFDHLDRDRNYRRNELLLVSTRTAREVLQSPFETQKLSALGLRQLINQLQHHSEAIRTEQLVVFRQYFEPSHSPLLCAVGMSKVNTPFIAGMGLFNKGKLSLVLPFPSANGLLWMLGNTHQITLTLPNQGDNSLEQQNSIRLLSTHRVINFQRTGSDFVANIDVSARAEINHYSESKNITPEVIASLEAQTEDLMQGEMKDAFRQMQEKDVDGAQLASELFREAPQTWKQIAPQWSDIYPKLKVNTNVRVHILRSGLSGRPPTSSDTVNGSLPPLE